MRAQMCAICRHAESYHDALSPHRCQLNTCNCSSYVDQLEGKAAHSPWAASDPQR